MSEQIEILENLAMKPMSSRSWTAYALLLEACGLNQREAATLHEVSIDTVNSWSTGGVQPPADVIALLRDFYNDLCCTAVGIVEEEQAHQLGSALIAYPTNDQEAQSSGFACIGAFRAMAAIVVADLYMPVSFVPYD